MNEKMKSFINFSRRYFHTNSNINGSIDKFAWNKGDIEIIGDSDEYEPDRYAADPCGDGGTSAGFQKGNTCSNGSGDYNSIKDMTEEDFMNSSMSPEESKDFVSRLRAGFSGSKNKGSASVENETGRLVKVSIPLSLFDKDYIDYIRESTDPDRVKSYSEKSIKDPIYAMPKRRGSGWQISDGGHRLMAAVLRGDNSINAVVPIISFDKLKSISLDQYSADPCGDSTGGFQPGNTCQPGGRGAKGGSKGSAGGREPSPGGGKGRAPAGKATQGEKGWDGEGTSSIPSRI